MNYFAGTPSYSIVSGFAPVQRGRGGVLAYSFVLAGKIKQALGFTYPSVGDTLPSVGFKLQTLGFTLPTVGCTLPTVGFTFQIVGALLQTLASALSSVGSILQTLGLALQPLGFTLQPSFVLNRAKRAVSGSLGIGLYLFIHHKNLTQWLKQYE